MTVNFRPNHTNYEGASSPSSLDGRFGFIYQGISIIFMLFEAIYGKNVESSYSQRVVSHRIATLSHVLIGIAMVVCICVFYDTWGIGIGLVLPFLIFAIKNLWYWLNVPADIPYVTRREHHLFNMAMLTAYSWFAAFQGLAPRIAYDAGMRDLITNTGPWSGDKKHSFDWTIFLLGIVLWIFYVPGVILWIWFRKKRTGCCGTSCCSSMANNQPTNDEDVQLYDKR